MLQNWFILMPEISLLSYLAVATLVNRYRAGKTAKLFYAQQVFFAGRIARHRRVLQSQRFSLLDEKYAVYDVV